MFSNKRPGEQTWLLEDASFSQHTYGTMPTQGSDEIADNTMAAVEPLIAMMGDLSAALLDGMLNAAVGPSAAAAGIMSGNPVSLFYKEQVTRSKQHQRTQHRAQEIEMEPIPIHCIL